VLAQSKICPYLFVYGTLRPAANSEWSRFLATVSDPMGAARTRGMLFRIAHYPGFVPGDGDDWVIGDVCCLHDPAALLPKLDAYEGCGPDDPPPHEYRRELVETLLDTGESLQAWAYVYCANTAGKTSIQSGDWISADPR